MSVEYEWRFGQNTSSDEPGEAVRRRRPRRRVWVGLAVAVVLLVALGLYGWWRLRRQFLTEAEEAVQAVARLEMRALADGDAELYLSLQDGADPQWLESQRTRLLSGTALPPPVPGFIASAPLTVEHPLVIEDRARVELVRMAGPPEGGQFPFRAVRFYRLAPDGRWLHTRADPKYAGRVLLWVGPRNDLAGYIAQDELMEQLAPELELTAVSFCSLFSCSGDVRFTLSFTSTPGPLDAEAGALPAPHLVGAPDSVAAQAAWIQAIKSYAVDFMLASVVGEPAGGLVDASLRTSVKELLGVARSTPSDLDLLAQALAEQVQNR